MAIHDTIGDFLTAIRNGSRAGRETIETPFSKMRLAIGEILVREGYLLKCEKIESRPNVPAIRITLKYVNKVPAITDVQRASRPGCRRYTGATGMPRVLGGLGFSIISTPKGVLKDSDARRQKVGGEVVCEVW
ncbi:MAG: 30S ribosomal protein S8 [Puniceicoccaceae bacterium]